MGSRFPHPPRVAAARLQGFSLTGLLVALAVVGGTTGLASYWWMNRTRSAPTANLLVHTVSRGEFVLDVTERGELESTGNVDVRCEVKSRNTTGTAILKIVAEGTDVEPGDFLVELDATALDIDRTAQKILVNTSEALMVQAENVYETSLIAKQEYLEGTFKQEKQTIQSEVFVAEENLRRAQEYYNYSKRLAAKGYITPLQLEADKFAVAKTTNELETARTKLHVLENFTQTKMIKQLESDILTNKAKWEAEKNSHELELSKLKEIEDQIAKCTIRAPIAGQVIYAHKSEGRGNDGFTVEEGAVVRERQVIIRLPDASRMQVKVKVNEASVNQIEPEMRGSIRAIGFKDTILSGTVVKINEYSEPGNWFKTQIKEFATFVRIDDPVPGLRPGMTAEVTIHCQRLPAALQAPTQALYAHGDEFYCLVQRGEGWEARKVVPGPNNESFAVIESGLTENDVVTLNPRQFLDAVDLPKLSAEQLQQVVTKGRAAPGLTNPVPSQAAPGRAESNDRRAATSTPKRSERPTAAVAGGAAQ